MKVSSRPITAVLLTIVAGSMPVASSQAPSPVPSTIASPSPLQSIPPPSPHVHVSYPTPVGPGSAARLQQLAGDLASPDPAVRADAARQLGHAINIDRVAATGHLVRALTDSDALVREKAAEAIGHSASTADAVRALITTLGDPVIGVRRAAAEALGAIGPAAATAGSPLAALIKDSDSKVRQAAAAALGKIGTTSPEVLDALSAALHVKDDPALRERAAHALGQSHHGEAALALLLAALDDSDAGVRREIVHAIGAMPTSHVTHMEPALRRVVVSETEPRVKIEALHALVKLGEAGVAGLSDGLSDTDSLVRWWAIIHLGQLGGAARPALPALERVAASDPKESNRASALRALEAVRGGAVQQ